MSAATFVLELSGEVRAWSGDAERVLGLPTPVVLGQQLPSPMREQLIPLISRVLGGAPLAQKAIRVERRGEPTRESNVSATAISRPDGRLDAVLLLATTPSEVDDEVALQAERDNLRATLEAAPVGLLVIDAAEQVIKANAAAERLFQTTLSSLSAPRCGDFLGCAHRHDDSGGCGSTRHCRVCELFAAIRRALQDGARTHDMELEAVVETRDDPECVWLAVNVEPLVLDGRRHAIVALNDITDRKRAANDLGRAEAKARAMVERLPLPTYVWKRERDDFVLTHYNLAAAEITQGGVARLVGLTLRSTHADRVDIIDDLERCYAEQSAFRRELLYRYRAIDEERELIVSYGYVPPDMVLVHTEDVTDRRRTEESQRESQRLEAIGQLAGGVAHDFNNLLLVINSNAEFALEALVESDPIREDVLEIRRAGRRAATLTRQLLAFSRKQILDPKVLNLNDLVGASSKMLRRVLAESIQIQIRAAHDLGNVKVDPGQVEHLIINLAVNARDAMPEGGVLTIETANVEVDSSSERNLAELEPGSYVRLSLSDTGVGMSSDTRQRAFEPFFTTKGIGKGTGLGLATVYGIVKQSGGAIAIESEPGRGAAFHVYLPRVEESVPSERPTLAPVRSVGEERVLVVEDDDAVRDSTVRILRRAGYRVSEASSAAEALARLEKEEPPHLLLTDVIMPHMSGERLAEVLLARFPKVKVVYMSGYTDDAIVHQGVLDEGTSFIAKPFTASALTRKVRETLAEQPGSPEE